MAGRTVTSLPPTDLDVAPGDFLAVMGPSGAGKTTLLNILAGLLRPTAGSLLFEGKDLSGLTDAGLARWRSHAVGYIFQSFNLVPVLTARENVELPGYLAGYSAAERRARCDSALRVVGMSHRADHKPDQLSGGERQRVAIARALVGGPPLLLCDEPTGNLDSANAKGVLDLLGLLNEDHGKTIVLVTHDAMAAARAGRVMTLEK